MKALPRTLFAVYLVFLLWVVLFKLSYDPFGVIRDFQTRSLNLIPFVHSLRGEMISNILAFIPFGVMLGVTFKELTFKHKIASIFAFSLVVEIIQYVLAIGVTDITDLIMNTLGGLVGISLYDLVTKHTNYKYWDQFILVSGTLILLTILYMRVFVFIIRY